MSASNYNLINVGGNNSGNININTPPSGESNPFSPKKIIEKICDNIIAISITTLFTIIGFNFQKIFPSDAAKFGKAVQGNKYKDTSSHESGTWIFYDAHNCTLGTMGDGTYDVKEDKDELTLIFTPKDDTNMIFEIEKDFDTNSFETKDKVKHKLIKQY